MTATRDRTKYDAGRHRSGASAEPWQRSTVLVQIRCSPELAAAARAATALHGRTLADVLAAGVEAMSGPEKGNGT